MLKPLRLLMAQINPTVGAIECNAQKIIDIIQSHQTNYELIIFPELCLTAYPPDDLLLRHELYERVKQSLHLIQQATTNVHVIIGHPTFENGNRYNSATLFHQKKKMMTYHKQKLPNYNVFDENRYFTPGHTPAPVILINGHRVGLCICEDVWYSEPIEQLINQKAELILCINASPFEKDKYFLREKRLKEIAQYGVAIAYVNQVGGQDDLVFDGQSLVLNEQATVVGRAPAFQEHLLSVVLHDETIESTITPLLDKDELIYQALVCGLRDYVEKNKFPGVLLGLSGGIDSSLTLCIAVDALGPSRVHAVMLPSRYTSEMSSHDALEQIRTLNVPHTTLPIEPAFHTLLETLSPSFIHTTPDTTEENLQARIRGTILMALSNKTNYLLLSTSNKSETAVGYATLYGDMNGGFAVLKDVLKTHVYQLARYRNQLNFCIPERVITRAPSAELAYNQTDQDHLPDYAILDQIIQYYMDDKLSAQAIIEKGFLAKDVHRIIKLIVRNEYKRRQAAPGVKISSRAFGRDWRYPITSGFLSNVDYSS